MKAQNAAFHTLYNCTTSQAGEVIKAQNAASRGPIQLHDLADEGSGRFNDRGGPPRV